METDRNSPEGELADIAAPGKKLSRKKLLLFIILPLLLLIGAGAGLYFTGKLDSFWGAKNAHEEGGKGDAGDKAENTGPGHYYDIPDIIVNLSDTGTKQRFLKLSISIEIPSKEDEADLQAVMPRITDHFQTYLRELRVEDLRGSAGIYRLRQELLARVKAAADPVDVRDILFREILVQ